MSSNKHGSSFSFITLGVITALVTNAAVGAGILFAAQLQQAEFKEQAESVAAVGETETFQCQYIEQGRLHREEIDAVDRLQAEEQVCGLQFDGVIIPPTLMSAYRPLVADPSVEPFLLAQRESCSCGDEERQVLSVDLVVPPKLGELEEVRALPRIANNPEDTRQDIVRPEERPPEQPPERPEERPEPDTRRVSQEPPPLDVENLADITDAHRPTNQDQEEGVRHGSRSGQGTVGRGDPYLQRVKATLDNTMRVPASIRSADRSRLKARIEIRVSASGTVLQWRWVERSNTAAFDNMIEQTMNRFTVSGSRSFPSPPPEWTNRRIVMSVDGRSLR